MRNILIIDDEAKFRKRFRKLLREAGFKVRQAPDAVEVANSLMRYSRELDLVLLDINMAEVDGRDTFDIINEYAPNIPILVTSVYPLQEQRLRIPRANDYFDKSDSDDILLKKVKKLLGVD